MRLAIGADVTMRAMFTTYQDIALRGLCIVSAGPNTPKDPNGLVVDTCVQGRRKTQPSTFNSCTPDLPLCSSP